MCERNAVVSVDMACMMCACEDGVVLNVERSGRDLGRDSCREVEEEEERGHGRPDDVRLE